MRVLIVEDDLNLGRMLEALFEDEGWTCVRAGDGREGLEQLMAGPIDVVVTDLMMPGADGFHLLDGMLTRGLDLPVYVFSAAHPSLLNQAKSYAPVQRVIRKLDGPLALLEAMAESAAKR
jgi:DNA-binding response OmpR family regulator